MCLSVMFFYYQFFEFSDLAASAMPDDRAIMTYVSSYYHTFAGAQKVCILTNYYLPTYISTHSLEIRKFCVQWNTSKFSVIYVSILVLFLFFISWNFIFSLGNNMVYVYIDIKPGYT